VETNLVKRSGGAAGFTEKSRFRQGDNASRIAGHLNPGDTLHEYAILNNIYDMTVPGKYSVRVDRRDVETDKIVKSNTLVINVTR
jgi:hypothetical protein